MARDGRSVDAYLAQLAPAEAGKLADLASRLRLALPGAIETVEWGMPAWVRPDGTMLAGIAAKKGKLAFYLCPAAGEDPFAPWRDRLPKSAIGKGCLRFRSLGALPEGMIDALIAAIAARV